MKHVAEAFIVQSVGPQDVRVLAGQTHRAGRLR